MTAGDWRLHSQRLLERPWEAILDMPRSIWGARIVVEVPVSADGDTSAPHLGPHPRRKTYCDSIDSIWPLDDFEENGIRNTRITGRRTHPLASSTTGGYYRFIREDSGN